MSIKYEDGMELQLWVWDTGELEGFAVYLNGHKFDEEAIPTMKYPIAKPASSEAIAVHFGGADGGATKVVDIANGKKKVLDYQNDGVKHSYFIDV